MAGYGGFTYNKIQLGREVTPGTSVVATHLWRGPMAMLEDDRQRKIAEEQIGILVPAERSYTTMLLGRMAMPSTELTFEQICHLLEASIKTATPSGAGPYVRSYPFPITSTPNTIKYYTIEAGNTQVPNDNHEMEYSFVDEFTIEGKFGESFMMGANWIGRQITPAPLTAGIAIPVVEEALVPKAKLYIDATGGTIGTTQKVGVFMGVKLRVRSGIVYVPVGDGNLYFYATKFTAPKLDFSISFELEGTNNVLVAERAIYVANAVRLFNIVIDGSSSARKIDIKWAGKYDKVGGYENQEGNTVVTLDGHGVLSSADSIFAQIDVTNSVATL